MLPARPPGQRQRLLLAAAEHVLGPCVVLGPVAEPSEPGGAGENGHGTVVLEDGSIHLLYQERAGDGRPWRYMRAMLRPDDVLEAMAASRCAYEGAV